MIFGIDVNHSTPVKNKSKNSSDKNEIKDFPSIAAVVGSVDENHCIYPAEIMQQQKTGKYAIEMVYHLNLPVFKLLQKYKKKNGKPPQKLIFFRDGISDGQFKKVSKHELDQIRKACADIENVYNPKISYIVVQKRHQTRFFPESNPNDNVPPGTLVDRIIVSPDKFDFFLCSHFGTQVIFYF